MNMLSFLGKTPTLALKKAQEECGEDAIVMTTKKINGGVDQEAVYEVVVAIEDGAIQKKDKKKVEDELYEKEGGYASKKRIYKVIPSLFAGLKFKIFFVTFISKTK